ncbi:MAG: 3'-5' exonuclease [Paludibacteraceae bacterium]
MFRPKISKEEINQLPLVEFRGKIIVVDNKEKENKAIGELSKEKVVGIDTETRPSFKRGVFYKVSLLQFSTENTSYLFRLNKIGFSDKLTEFLSKKEILKVGLSLRDDFNGLGKQKKFKPECFVDIQNIAKEYGILELSLQKIYAIIFGQKISKSQRLSNWENEVLTEKQQRYAATDAWATLQIYLLLTQEKKLTKQEQKDLINNFNNQSEINLP